MLSREHRTRACWQAVCAISSLRFGGVDSKAVSLLRHRCELYVSEASVVSATASAVITAGKPSCLAETAIPSEKPATVNIEQATGAQRSVVNNVRAVALLEKRSVGSPTRSLLIIDDVPLGPALWPRGCPMASASRSAACRRGGKLVAGSADPVSR
jgi:hypothetical protein